MTTPNHRRRQHAWTAAAIVCGTPLLLAPQIESLAAAQRASSANRCLSNLRRIGAAAAMYTADYDDTLFPLKTRAANRFKGVEGVSENASRYTFYNQTLHPYAKDWDVWRCPDNPFAWVNQERATGSKHPVSSVAAYLGYGGQNSYGANAYLFPGGNGRRRSDVPEPSETVFVTDARYYIVLPPHPPALAGVTTTGEYGSYWKNLGNSYFFRARDGKPAPVADDEARRLGKARHGGNLHLLYLDGHVEPLAFDKATASPTRWLPSSR